VRIVFIGKWINPGASIGHHIRPRSGGGAPARPPRVGPLPGPKKGPVRGPKFLPQTLGVGLQTPSRQLSERKSLPRPCIRSRFFRDHTAHPPGQKHLLIFGMVWGKPSKNGPGWEGARAGAPGYGALGWGRRCWAVGNSTPGSTPPRSGSPWRKGKPPPKLAGGFSLTRSLGPTSNQIRVVDSGCSLAAKPQSRRKIRLLPFNRSGSLSRGGAPMGKRGGGAAGPPNRAGIGGLLCCPRPVDT